MSQLQMTLVGTKSLMMHNARLANPMDPFTRRLKQLTSQRNKTDELYAEIMHVEARGGAYETEEGLLGLPASCVWATVYNAAKAFKLGADTKRALIVDPTAVSPIELNGAKVTVDDFLSDPEHVDWRNVVISGKRTMRARPLVPAGWRAVIQFELLDDVLDFDRLLPVVQRAGRLVGLLEWRPMLGTFDAELVQS